MPPVRHLKPRRHTDCAPEELVAALHENRGRRDATAHALGMSKQALHAALAAAGLDRDAFVRERPRTPDRAEFEAMLRQTRGALEPLGDAFGIPYPRARSLCGRYGVDPRVFSRDAEFAAAKARLPEVARRLKGNQTAIASELGVQRTTVSKWADELGVPLRRRAPAKKPRGPDPGGLHARAAESLPRARAEALLRKHVVG